MPILNSLVALAALLLLPEAAWAAGGASPPIDLTMSWVGFAAVGIFVIAYAVVMAEEFLHLRKSKPVLIAAGVIWMLIGAAFAFAGDTHTAETAVRHYLLEFAELFLFLLAAMTFINTMGERRVFDRLRAWLVGRGFSLRQLFWVTGILAFFISPVADNLTTALLMGAVVMAVGVGKPKFVALGCINVVVAANAGGAFSPFGDITTLMVWQKGILEFTEFFALFVPSLVNWLVPAAIMAMAIEKAQPAPLTEAVTMKPGALAVIALFAFTIVMAVCFHNFLHLPPVLGMLTGLGLLKLYGYFLKKASHQGLPLDEPDDVFARTDMDGTPPVSRTVPAAPVAAGGVATLVAPAPAPAAHGEAFDIFRQVEKAEWDTLMFFCGVILCVGGLGTIGYLAMASQFMYGVLGATTANVLVGVLSAIVDNIPVMFAVLQMQPEMSHGQWLLVTLTAGVGGSMLSIGSAAGVALMGQARGIYTFFSHLKWTWAIALGYAASILVHLWLNAKLF